MDRTTPDGANRRRFLEALGALGLTELAGCGGDTDGATEPADTTEPGNTTNPRNTTGATGTAATTETGRFLVRDLQLDADGETVDVSATIENMRAGTDLQMIECRLRRIAGERTDRTRRRSGGIRHVSRY